VETGYYEFDGVEGGGSAVPSDYGIQVKFDTSHDRGSNTGRAALVQGVGLPAGVKLKNIYFNNAKFTDIGSNANYALNGGKAIYGLGDSFYVGYSLFSGGVVAIENDGLGSPVPIIEHNHFTGFYSSTSGVPCQNQVGSIVRVVSQSGWIIRFNHFKDIIESGLPSCAHGPEGSISMAGSTTFPDGEDGNGLKIAGNIFQGEAYKEHIGWGETDCPWKAHDWLIYNNHFVNTIGGIGRSTYFDGQCGSLPVDGWEVKNNLSFDCTGEHTNEGNLNFDFGYNLYDLAATLYASDLGATKILSTLNKRRMFVLHPSNLKPAPASSAIDAGEDLGVEFNDDPDGNERGGNGLWDVGAFEFTGETGTYTGGGVSGSSGS
jgi:hypothetical protein